MTPTSHGPSPARTSLLALLLVGAALSLTPAAQASGQCGGGRVDPTTWSPSGYVPTAPATITAVFHATGPGYAAAVCDTGWISTCTLIVDGVTVTNGPPPPSQQATTPMDCNGSGGYAATPPTCSPDVTGCEVTLNKAYTLSPGVHQLQAIVGVSWGCCLWNGGPEAQGSVTWEVIVGTGTDACPEGVDPNTASACGQGPFCPTGTLDTSDPDHIATVCGQVVDNPCRDGVDPSTATVCGNTFCGSGTLDTSDPSHIATVCGHSVDNPCPQGVDPNTARVCSQSPLCPTGVLTTGGGHLATVCGVPVDNPCPQGVDPNTARVCSQSPLCPTGVLTTGGGHLATVCGVPVDNPCPGGVNTNAPPHLATVCGVPVDNPCPQGVDALHAGACGTVLCPNGVTQGGGPGQFVIVCGNPVNCPPSIHANCSGFPCSTGVTSPAGPGELAVVCGFPVGGIPLVPTCMDGVDNDGDGHADYRPSQIGGGDPKCTSPFGNE